jgi:hypothetical protein
MFLKTLTYSALETNAIKPGKRMNTKQAEQCCRSGSHMADNDGS